MFRILTPLLVLPLAGCLWSSQTEYDFGYGNGPSTTLTVVVDSERSLSGVEQVTEYVYPGAYDSVQSITINGTLVWTASPPFTDSAAPYFLDGRTNTVTIAWPTTSKTDTESFRDLYQLYSPKPGDTISRAAGVTLRYPAVYEMKGQRVLFDDVTDTITTYLDSTGTRQIPGSSLALFPGPWVRITLPFFYNQGSWSQTNEYSTDYFITRSVQYPIR